MTVPSLTKRAWRCLAPLVPVFLCGLALIILGRAPWGCGPARPPVTPDRPITYSGVPIIRVRLSSQPVDCATISTTSGGHFGVDERTTGGCSNAEDEVVVTRQGRMWRFNGMPVEGEKAFLAPNDHGHALLGRTGYRGRLVLLPVGEARFIVTNHVDLESYLAGVLAKELYRSWHLETYRALAIAARTYATYHMLTFGRSHDYDIGSTQAAQVYGGIDGETPKAWQAVRNTHGQVLTCRIDGEDRVFQAQYSACCGGRVNGARVLRNARQLEPLEGGQVCTECSRCPRYRWQSVTVAKADVGRALADWYRDAKQLGRLESLRAAGRDRHGRTVWVEAVGTGGRVRVRADDLRLCLLRSNVPQAGKLYSMNCKFRDVGETIEFYDGRGFGHGVGLCQWGAEGRATAGAMGEDILSFYYPGATTVQSY